MIEEALDSGKAEEVITVKLDDSSSLADYMVIASGTSTRHVSSLARNLKDALSLKGVKNITTEGLAQCDWVVIDTGDIIVHLFRPEVRAFYNIEKMWCTNAPFDVVDNQIQA
ncbi:MAG: ribosome silencing factor [Alphaproteobacteria bacterium]